MQKIGLAIAGFGGMAHFHAGNFKQMERVLVKGIFDINPAVAERAREDGYHTYANLEEMVSDPEVQIVLIATPNEAHRPIALAAMNAGKHVFCEKPVALNSEELQEMIDCAVKNNVLFTVDQNGRMDHDFLTVKRIYEANLLGELFCVESRVHGSRGIPGDWRKEREHGGGMVLDWGIHLFDQLLMLTDMKVKSVYAKLHHLTCSEVDDGFKVILTWENGMTALAEVGTSHFINMPRWAVQGINGTAVIRSFNNDGEMVCARCKPGADAVPVRTAAGLTKTMAPRTDDTIVTLPLPEVSGSIFDVYNNVFDALEGKCEPWVTHAHLQRSMRLMEAVFESDKLGQAIDFE